MPDWETVATQSVGEVASASWANSIANNMSDTGWVMPSLQNGFGYASSYNNKGLRMIGNQVFLQIAVDTGGASGDIAFDLPSGMTPSGSSAHVIPGESNGPNALAAWEIGTDGTCTLFWTTITGSVDYLACSGSYLID